MPFRFGSRISGSGGTTVEPLAGGGAVKLTDAGIRALKPGRKTYAVYGDHLRSFGVRVSARGAKTFTFLYRLHGRKIRLNLGRFGSVSLADARAEAHRASGAVRGERKDARVAREEAEIRATGGLTVTGLTDFYLASDKFRAGREATRDQLSVRAGAAGARPKGHACLSSSDRQPRTTSSAASWSCEEPFQRSRTPGSGTTRTAIAAEHSVHTQTRVGISDTQTTLASGTPLDTQRTLPRWRTAVETAEDSSETSA
jgi:hypothetical protein